MPFEEFERRYRAELKKLLENVAVIDLEGFEYVESKKEDGYPSILLSAASASVLELENIRDVLNPDFMTIEVGNDLKLSIKAVNCELGCLRDFEDINKAYEDPRDVFTMREEAFGALKALLND